MSVFSKSYDQDISFNLVANSSQYYLIFLLFLIWPFGAFLYAFYNYDKSESKIILILFNAIFGYSLIAESGGLDLARVLKSLAPVTRMTFTEFQESRISEGSVDIYRDIVTFIVSRFTSNPKWLMFTFGIVAGYFYTRVLSIFINEHPGRDIYKIILVFSFSCIIGIDQLAGVRMSLAAYVFFYGAIKVIVHEDKRFLILAASSSLIHFSFISAIFLLLIFPLLKKHSGIIYIILALSFILPDLLQDYIQRFSGFFGQGIEARAQLYYEYDPAYHTSDPSWYVRDRNILMMIYFYLVFLIIQIKRKRIILSESTNSLFLFSLIILSFVNFTLNIPSFGSRFQHVFLMFALFYLYKIYTENSDSLLVSYIVIFSIPFSLLIILYSLRSTLSITPLSLYYFNLPGLFFDNSVYSAWTAIRSF